MKLEKVFPSKWLASTDLDGGDIILRISKVTQEEVGQDREIKPILWFEDHEKGLILNVTNWRNLSTICGSDDSDDWTGKKVQLYVAAVQFGGKEVNAIRVRPVGGRLPDPKQALPTGARPDPEADRVDVIVVGTIIKQQDSGTGRIGVQIKDRDEAGTKGHPAVLWAGFEKTVVLDAVKTIGGNMATCSLHQHKSGKYSLIRIEPYTESMETDKQEDLDGLPF